MAADDRSPKRRGIHPLRKLAFLAFLALAATASGWWYARQWKPDIDSFPVQGLDVTSAHGTIDWKSVRADQAEFAYIRASIGSQTRDTEFARNWQEAAAAGLRRGAIHDFSLCQLADDQAANFIATVPREGKALPATIRLGFDEGCAARPARQVLIGEVERLAKAMEAHAEQPVILSVDQSFEDAYRLSEAIDRPLWLRKPWFPPDFGARAWIMWQATSYRHVDGVRGPANWSVVRP